MFYLRSVLENFNNCTKLPISLFNSNFDILNSCGHDEVTKEITNNINVIKDLKSKYSTNSKLTFDYPDNISFLFIPFTFNINKPLFFLIGPFCTSNLCNYHNITVLNSNNFKYINSLLSNILEDVSMNTTNPFVNRTIQYIHSRYSENISIDKICEELNINKYYFCNLFKKETGYTFVQFLTLWRIEKSKIYLKNPSISLLDVALNVGFSNQGYYSTTFKKITGQTPSEYKKNIS
ncbi:helix-turn-helix transcriptional regulator [Clostridium sp.]|uniref:helix-turn-helix transcriptional regulator n=1 Tax=Clostridium sp. TaxID=1506 RepID=UPI00399391A6